jgi:hypothetical protein
MISWVHMVGCRRSCGGERNCGRFDGGASVRFVAFVFGLANCCTIVHAAHEIMPRMA